MSHLRGQRFSLRLKYQLQHETRCFPKVSRIRGKGIDLVQQCLHTYRVRTLSGKPGKMRKLFPVREKSGKIREIYKFNKYRWVPLKPDFLGA